LVSPGAIYAKVNRRVQLAITAPVLLHSVGIGHRSRTVSYSIDFPLKLDNGHRSRSGSCWGIAAEDEVRDSTVSQELLWLWHGDSSGTHKSKHPPLEAGTRGLVRNSRLRINSVSKHQRNTCS
jgi:hypothetical protein